MNDEYKAGENTAWSDARAWLWGLLLFLALTLGPALIEAL